MRAIKIVSTTVISLFLIACGNESEIKAAVRNHLIDPDSVRFEGLIFSKNKVEACIIYNAKNRFGGYAGQQIARLKKYERGWIVEKMEESERICNNLGAEMTYADEIEKNKEKLLKNIDHSSAHKQWSLGDLMDTGKKVYAIQCQACHRQDGTGVGPIASLDGSATVLNDDKGKQLSALINGEKHSNIVDWKKLSNTDLAAVITFMKNSWGNKTGQIIQPVDMEN